MPHASAPLAPPLAPLLSSPLASDLLSRLSHRPSQPVLTLDGDLDGLLRATRQAEAYYHQVLRPSQQRLQRQSSSPASSQPVILLEGLNHWSISSGPVPSNVKKHDLPAEVGEEQGHQVLATALTEFIVSLWGRGTDQQEAAKSVVARLAATQTFVQPIIDA